MVRGEIQGGDREILGAVRPLASEETGLEEVSLPYRLLHLVIRGEEISGGVPGMHFVTHRGILLGRRNGQQRGRWALMRSRCVVDVVQTVVVGIEADGKVVGGLLIVIVGGSPWKEKEIIDSAYHNPSSDDVPLEGALKGSMAVGLMAGRSPELRRRHW